MGSVFKDDLDKRVKILDGVCLLDNLRADFWPEPQRPDSGRQLLSMRMIRPDAPYPGTLVLEDLQETLGPMAVLNTDGLDTTVRSKPTVPTRIWRLRPLTCLCAL
jgi:hypothetical protein